MSDKKFLVVNYKHLADLSEEDIKTLNEILSKVKLDHEYYVCNTDEPYAEDVINTILAGEADKEAQKEACKKHGPGTLHVNGKKHGKGCPKRTLYKIVTGIDIDGPDLQQLKTLSDKVHDLMCKEMPELTTTGETVHAETYLLEIEGDAIVQGQSCTIKDPEGRLHHAPNLCGVSSNE